MTRVRSAVAAVAVALLSGGCGDGKTTTSPTTTVAASPTTSPSRVTTTTALATTATTVSTAPASRPAVVDDVLRGESAADRYTYDQTFPKLQGLADAAVQDAINAQILTEVTALVDEFVVGAREVRPPPDQPDLRSALKGSYDVVRLDDGLASIRLHVSRYSAGAAHPGAVLVTFNYDLRTGKRLALADLFTAGSPYLAKLSETSRQQLAAEPYALDDFIRPGTEPTAENFAGWTLTDEELVITFAEYQVAPYAAGMPKVSIPFASLRTLLDPTGPLAIAN